MRENELIRLLRERATVPSGMRGIGDDCLAVVSDGVVEFAGERGRVAGR